MLIKTILVQPGTVKPSAFLSKINDPVEENTMLSLVSSVAALIVLYVLKVIIIVHSMTLEEDGTWKADVPWWIQAIFVIAAAICMAKISYFYRKFKQQ
jgi:ABC-type polysaccharide/polyol phosphate export permease